MGGQGVKPLVQPLEQPLAQPRVRGRCSRPQRNSSMQCQQRFHPEMHIGLRPPPSPPNAVRSFLRGSSAALSPHHPHHRHAQDRGSLSLRRITSRRSSFHLFMSSHMASWGNSTAVIVVMAEVSASLVRGPSKRPYAASGLPDRDFPLFASSFIVFSIASPVSLHCRRLVALSPLSR